MPWSLGPLSTVRPAGLAVLFPPPPAAVRGPAGRRVSGVFLVRCFPVGLRTGLARILSRREWDVLITGSRPRGWGEPRAGCKSQGYLSREQTFMGVGAEPRGRGMGGASRPIPNLHASNRDLKEKMTTRGRDTWFRAAPELGNSENVIGAPDWKSASFSYTVVSMWPEF